MNEQIHKVYLMAGKTPKPGVFVLKLMAGDHRIALAFPVPESYAG